MDNLTHFFCHQSKAFYPFELKGLYEKNGTWPTDGVYVPREIYAEFNAPPPDGRALAVGEDGLPSWELVQWTEEKLRARKSSVVYAHLDNVARRCGFSSMSDGLSYVNEPAVPEFMEKGRALRAWRSLVWQAFYAILADVELDAQDVPTDAALLALLPPFQPPTEEATESPVR